MIKARTNLQDLRRKIYIKAKAEKSWRFWGIYVHVCKLETLRASYDIAKRSKGAPGIDGLTFEMITTSGTEQYLRSIQRELLTKTYYPSRKRVKEIPKEGNKMRRLQIPTIKDRIVEGALKLILEPIFEADFQPGSYGYRPKRTAAAAIEKVRVAAIRKKTRVIDVDLHAYFDTIAHFELFKKIGSRVKDQAVMRLVKLIVKANGKKGLGQGGPLSPLLSNIYLTEVDTMLEKAKAYCKERDGYDHLSYVRWADDLVILIDGQKKMEMVRTSSRGKITTRIVETKSKAE